MLKTPPCRKGSHFARSVTGHSQVMGANEELDTSFPGHDEHGFVSTVPLKPIFSIKSATSESVSL